MTKFWDEPSTPPTRAEHKTRRRSPQTSRTPKRNVVWLKPTLFTDSSPPTFQHSPSLPLSLDSPSSNDLATTGDTTSMAFNYIEMAKSLQEILDDNSKGKSIITAGAVTTRPHPRGAKRNHHGELKSPAKKKRSTRARTTTIQVRLLPPILFYD